MHTIKTYEQTAIYDPTNPTQRQREVYAGIPGGYASYYFNEVPNTSSLGGLRGLGFWSGIPTWLQAGIVVAGAGVIGFFGMKKLGPSIKSKLGLSGTRRRRGKRR